MPLNPATKIYMRWDERKRRQMAAEESRVGVAGSASEPFSHPVQQQQQQQSPNGRDRQRIATPAARYRSRPTSVSAPSRQSRHQGPQSRSSPPTSAEDPVTYAGRRSGRVPQSKISADGDTWHENLAVVETRLASGSGGGRRRPGGGSGSDRQSSRPGGDEMR